MQGEQGYHDMSTPPHNKKNKNIEYQTMDKVNFDNSDDSDGKELLLPRESDTDPSFENPFTVEDYRSSFGFDSKIPSRERQDSKKTKIIAAVCVAVVVIVAAIGFATMDGPSKDAKPFAASDSDLPCDVEIFDISKYGVRIADPQAHYNHCVATVQCVDAHVDAIISTTSSSDLFLLRMTHVNLLDTMTSNINSLNGLLQLTSPLADMVTSTQDCNKLLQSQNQNLSQNVVYFESMQEFNTTEINAKENLTLVERYYGSTLYGFTEAQKSVLNASAQARIFEVETLLSGLQTNFSLNIARAVKNVTRFANDSMALTGLETDFVASHTDTASGTVTFTTDYPDYMPVMHGAANESLRLDLYRQFNSRAHPENEHILQAILTARLELAQLHNKTDYAEYLTENMMVKNPETIRNYLGTITNVINGSIANEFADIQTFMDQHPDNVSLDVRQPYNFGYASAEYKEDKFKVDQDEVAKYFTAESTTKGVFAVAANLFGLTMEKTTKLAVWDPSVVAYMVKNASGTVVGHAYLDLYPRANKFKHAAMFPIRRGARSQIAAAALVCNFPKDAPMGFQEVTTFFHEFGHLMHFVLGGTHQQWVPFSGMGAVSWDFVEAPSQMLEKWPMAMDVLDMFAKNDKGEVIPEATVNAIEEGNKFSRGIYTKQQIYYAMLSLELHEFNVSSQPHCSDAVNKSMCWQLSVDVAKIAAKYSPFKYDVSTHMYSSFGHLNGYGPLYYTYQWSLGIAQDMFYSKFCPRKMMNKFRAKQYTKAILQPGGKQETTDLLTAYLNRPWNETQYIRFLKKENKITCARHHTSGDH